MKDNQKGSAVLWSVIIIVLLAVGIGYYLYEKNASSSQPSESSVEQVLDTSSWKTYQNRKTYTNNQYGFSFNLPEYWVTQDAGLNNILFETPAQHNAGDKPLEVAYEILFQPGDQSATIRAQGDKTLGTIVLGGITWTMTEDYGGPADLLVYTTKQNSQIYNFWVYAVNEEILKQALSTFQFTK